jgi:proline dehydrogenase
MLARLVPAPLVRWFARPYVAGDSLEKALDVAAREQAADGLLSTLDVLGEDVHTAAQVAGSVALYQRLIETVASDPRFAAPGARPTVSLKPSAFTAGAREEARDPLADVVAHADAHGVGVTIDMEDRRWTDLTLDWAVGFFEQGRDVGTVLQTRLHRTEADLARIPAGMRLRLVIGIYPEPEDVALVEKPAMKDRMVDYAARLLDRGVFVEFATHDVATVERFAAEVAPRAPERVEVKMLLGVPRRALQRRLRAQGLAVRLYVPFANGWDDATAYLRRRMAESPSTVWLVLRNLFAARAR